MNAIVLNVKTVKCPKNNITINKFISCFQCCIKFDKLPGNFSLTLSI